MPISGEWYDSIGFRAVGGYGIIHAICSGGVREI
jgi:hypothetical protein